MSEKITFPKLEQMKNIRLLEHTNEDYSSLARLFNSFKDSDSWPDGFGGSRIFTGDYIKEQYKTKDLSSYYVFINPENEEELLGLCFCEKAWNLPDSWYVELLGVDPAQQNKKLGKALLLIATEFAYTQKSRLISLHTWGGNLKAMPLYKRQGYKWRPDTMVYMENYIPQILAFPYFNDFFTKYIWYDVFKPVITQEVDEEFDNKMAIYEYYFESDDGKESLRVWIDRTIGRISGFHLNFADNDIIVKASIFDSENYIGENVEHSLLIKNNSSNNIEITINYESSETILLQDESKKSLNFTVQGQEEKIITSTTFIDFNTQAFNMQENNHAYTPHNILSTIRVENVLFSLYVGMAPKNRVYCILPTAQSINHGETNTLNIAIQNNGEEDVKGYIEISSTNNVEILQSSQVDTISKYGSTFSFPIRINDYLSQICEFRIIIKNEGKQKIYDRMLPVPFFANNQSLSYEFDNILYLENKHLRLKIDKDETRKANEIIITDKVSGFELFLEPMVLGYPFMPDGTEYATNKLQYQIENTPTGIILKSLAKSNVKTDIILTRKIFLGNDDRFISHSYHVLNDSQQTRDDLGLLFRCYRWWSFRTIMNTFTHYRGRIVENNLPFLKDFNKNPKDFTEGWIASQFPECFVGYILDSSKLEAIAINPETPPSLEYNLSSLEPTEELETQEVYITFQDSWKDVRRFWAKKFRNEKSLQYIEYSISTDKKKIGLSSDGNSLEVYNALVFDIKKESPFLSLDLSNPIDIQGSITVVDSLSTKKIADIQIPAQSIASFQYPLSTEHITQKLENLSIECLLNERTFNSERVLCNYDSDATIAVKSYQEKEKEVLEVDNGFITFKGSKDHRGTIFHLAPNTEDNYLLTHFPEVKPFMWSNKFFGGLNTILLDPIEWNVTDFNQLKFTSQKVEKGKMVGIGFISEIINYCNVLKGLQLETNYLTLPNSPFVVVETIVHNHSHVIRSPKLVLTFSLDTQNQQATLHTTDNKQKITVHTQDYEASIPTRDYTTERWCSYKHPLRNHFLTTITLDSDCYKILKLFSYNLKITELNEQYFHMSIPPKSSKSYYTLILFTDQIEYNFDAFLDTNLFELMK